MNLKHLISLSILLLIPVALHAMESQTLKTAYVSISLSTSNPKDSVTKELTISYHQGGYILSPSAEELTQTLSLGSYEGHVVFGEKTNTKRMLSRDHPCPTRFDTLKIAAKLLVNGILKPQISGDLSIGGDPCKCNYTNYPGQGIPPQFATLTIVARSEK